MDLGSVEGRECAGIASADIDQDLSPEIIICCLNGDVAVYKARFSAIL